jgi:transcriptional regulator GlxA family with amidase domain
MAGPGTTILVPSDEAFRFDWDDFDVLYVCFPTDQVRRTAAELTGMAPADLRFLGPRPVSQRAAALWRLSATMLHQELRAPDSMMINPLVHQEFANTLVAAAVSTFPNTALTRGYVPNPGDTRPAAVRRAAAYIDAHDSLPITVTDVATAAGTSPRALRAAFRRHLDTTPTAYLRRVRLEAAHHDLQAADPTTGTTVAQVAARWGFTDADRFAAAHQGAYKCSPSETLRV